MSNLPGYDPQDEINFRWEFLETRGNLWRRNSSMNMQPMSSVGKVLAGLRSLLPDLEALYTDVHAHPELSMQESRTAGWRRIGCAPPAMR